MSCPAPVPGADLAAGLRAVLGAEGSDVTVDHLVRLAGGASRETWRFSCRTGDAARTLVLRRDPVGAPPSGVRLEAALLAAAARHGVPVPAVVTSSDDVAALGSAFVVMAHVDGETIPRRILRDEALAGARAALTGQCGAALAAIHRIPPDEVPGLPDDDALAQLRTLLDRSGEPHPAFELAFRWLAANRPASSDRTVVHGDFRNGNLIVGPDGLRAVLDWELAHVGDPLEDLGWLCVKAWRFGSPLPAGGFGTVDDLVAAYEAASGRTVDRRALRWWEVLGTLRWGVICIVQVHTHTTGVVRSVELAAVGRRVCEVEWDLLELLAGAEDGTAGTDRPAAVDGAEIAAFPGAPHDVPTAVDLLHAVREFLDTDVGPATEGRVRFLARVAGNVLAMVARQIELGPGQHAAHARRLAALGVADEEELAAAVRSGALDDRRPEVVAAVRATVADKLAVANPRHLAGREQ